MPALAFSRVWDSVQNNPTGNINSWLRILKKFESNTPSEKIGLRKNPWLDVSLATAATRTKRWRTVPFVCLVNIYSWTPFCFFFCSVKWNLYLAYKDNNQLCGLPSQSVAFLKSSTFGLIRFNRHALCLIAFNGPKVKQSNDTDDRNFPCTMISANYSTVF